MFTLYTELTVDVLFIFMYRGLRPESQTQKLKAQEDKRKSCEDNFNTPWECEC